MGPKSKPKTKGPMDKYYVKIPKTHLGENTSSNLPAVVQPAGKLAASPGTSSVPQPQRGSSAAACHIPLDQQGKKPHATHSFEWCYNDKKPIKLTCDRAGSVEELLKRSEQFKKIAEKNKNKELVIVRDGKALSTHFPCCLVKNDRLTVKFIKAAPGLASVENQGPVVGRNRPSEMLVTFHVLTNGGKKLMKIIRNPALKQIMEEITVYAYKGEKVKHALKRDGRFLKTIFKRNCALSNTSTEVITEMSNLVDDLVATTFKIILLNKSSPPESPPGSLEDCLMENGSQIREDGNQDPPQQPTTSTSVNDGTPAEKPKPNDKEPILYEMPNSKEMRGHLISLFKDVVKEMNSQKVSKPLQNLFRVEYGKNAQSCNEVKTMKILMDLSNSVCQVRINDLPKGSGFVLFGQFVLTNGHVVKDIYNESTGQFHERLTIHFSDEGLMESGAKVEAVEAFEYGYDACGDKYDWALLRICADVELPDGLLGHFGFLPQSGGICIIGYPEGCVKRIDPCWITTPSDRNQVVEKHRQENPHSVIVEDGEYSETPRHIQMVTQNYFEGVSASVQLNKHVLTYESCFYGGSSGSPVFDEYCNVVAMHTGGYLYGNERGERRSVIEYGHPLSVIIEHMIVQLVLQKKFDVLKKYLACSYGRQHEVMICVKRLVESRNFSFFESAVTNPVVMNDESLKVFFEFICQKEQPVPMDT